MKYVLISISALVLAILAWARASRDRKYYIGRLKEFQAGMLDAQKALRQRGELANEIAHEIKNPVTAILCSAETLDLLIGESLDESHRKSLRYIREYGDNLLRLVSDFLDVSRAESGQIHARPEAVRVLPLVNSIVGLLESNAIKKKITVKSFATLEDLRAMIDPKHLKQIVFNLLHNAIKFTPEGGEVQIVVSSAFPQPFLKIAVKDNGRGIEAVELPFIFDPYAHCAGHSPSLDTGTGLGLALCKALSEMAGGYISVESTPMVGSCFIVTLPQAGVEQSSARKSAAHELAAGSSPLTGQRILLIDNDQIASESVASLIEALGGMVDQVALSSEAVQALGTHSYNAVLIDDTRDGVDACELSSMIRNDMLDSATTIVVASSTHYDEQQLHDAGVDRCLAKPLNGKSLVETLTKPGRFTITH